MNYSRSADLLRLLSLFSALSLSLNTYKHAYSTTFVGSSFFSYEMILSNNINRFILQLATISNDHGRNRSIVAIHTSSLNCTNHFHSLDNFAKHDMLTIQMRSRNLHITLTIPKYGSNEELRTIRVSSSISHRQKTSS